MTPALFETLAESLPGIIYLMEADASRYTYVNPPIVRTVGFPAEKFYESGPSFTISRVHPDDLEGVMRRHVENAERLAHEPRHIRDRYVHIDEYRFQHADGHWIWLRSSAVAFEWNPDGTLKSVLGVAQDVTDRKEMEARMRLTERMASVGRLAAGMAHEINNPLTHLIGVIDLLAEKATPHKQELATMRASAERIEHLVADLKGFSRPEDDESLNAVSIEQVVEAALPIAGNEIRHRARLLREYSAAPRVRANAARLGQVVLNLLTNAAQSIPDGRSEENAIVVRVFKDESGRGVLEVRDTGEGMSRETLRRIFDPFFTTKPVGKGTGLGLTICYHIIQSFSGELEVESEAGKGSLFRVRIPAAERTSEASREKFPGEDSQAAQSMKIEPPLLGRILVVEDDVAVAEVLRGALAGENDVTVWADSRQGLRLLGEPTCPDFDLIFCDLVMPQVSGMEFFAPGGSEDPPGAWKAVRFHDRRSLYQSG
jgi:PAS domain S-box-containing protein